MYRRRAIGYNIESAKGIVVGDVRDGAIDDITSPSMLQFLQG